MMYLLIMIMRYHADDKEPGNELIIRDTVDHDVLAAEVQPGQLSVQTENNFLENSYQNNFSATTHRIFQARKAFQNHHHC